MLQLDVLQPQVLQLQVLQLDVLQLDVLQLQVLQHFLRTVDEYRAAYNPHAVNTAPLNNKQVTKGGNEKL